MSETEHAVDEPLIEGGEWPDAAAEVPVGKTARRLTPLTGGLLALAIAAAGFVGGVLVELGQTGPSTGAGALPAGLAHRVVGPPAWRGPRQAAG